MVQLDFGGVKMDIIKELFNNFITSSIVTKILIFVSAFFAPVWELYILLIFLVTVDYIVDLGVWFFSKEKQKHWEITQPFIIKLIMYSILVIVVNAVQMHLIKEAFEIFKLIMAIPIGAELLGILSTIEKHTGVAIVDKVRQYLGNWISSKEPKKDDNE